MEPFANPHPLIGVVGALVVRQIDSEVEFPATLIGLSHIRGHLIWATVRCEGGPCVGEEIDFHHSVGNITAFWFGRKNHQEELTILSWRPYRFSHIAPHRRERLCERCSHLVVCSEQDKFEICHICMEEQPSPPYTAVISHYSTPLWTANFSTLREAVLGFGTGIGGPRHELRERYRAAGFQQTVVFNGELVCVVY